MATQLSPARDAPYAPAPAAAAVHLAALTKRFVTRQTIGERLRNHWRRQVATVIDDVSFDVMSGEIFGLLGPNGAGKTTIFKMLSTMIVPDSGTAIVAGYDVVRDAECVRQVLAAVPADERSLNWRLTAYENLKLFASLNQLDRRHAALRIDSLLQTVGLAATGSKLVGTFSSGMRQRLLIARALLGNPHVLLLDEPTRSLDPISAHEFREFLRRELVDAAGCTILLATHDASEAFSFCDRVGVLHQGRVLAIGAARDLSATFSEERYRLVIRSHADVAFDDLESAQLLRHPRVAEPAADGWATVECTIDGGASATSRLVARLVAAGIEVARIERVEPSLADLISRIIAREERSHA